jgi:hypothetical protein
MLIFDRFPSREQAESFAAATKSRFNRDATIHESQDESDAIDPFPGELEPPIVLVERNEATDDDQIEELQIQDSVEEFGGVFAGT